MATRQCKVDIQGGEIEPGQKLAVAFRSGNTSSLRLGVVESIRSDEGYYGMPVTKVKVNWLTGSVKTSEIECDPARIAVVS